jgi:phenylacetate-CoA ligase
VSRFDDMLKVKGMTVWPSAVDGVLFSCEEVDEYRAIVSDVGGGREELRLQVALRRNRDQVDVDVLAERLATRVKETVFVTPRIEIVPELEHFEFKERRWRDERAKVQ